MKIQDLLSQYLYQQKSLTLPGLGVFELDPAVNIYDQKDEGWPAHTIRFIQNRSATVTDEFLHYLVEHTGKMKPLAMSDLESYLSNGVQLLNIGKPFPLKGIGSLSKTTAGDFIFEQGSEALEKINTPLSDLAKDKTIDQPLVEIDFSSSPKKSSKKLIVVVGAILAVAIIGWAVYLAIPKKEAAEELSETEAASDPVVITPADTTASKPTDSLTNATPVTAPADTSFVLQVGEFNNKLSADKRIATLLGRGHRVELQMKDSFHYAILLKVNKPLKDTTYVMDSLSRYYEWKSRFVKAGN